MDRRDFVKRAGALALSCQASRVAAVPLCMSRLRAAESPGQTAEDIPNWADQAFKPQATASSYFIDPPWGYIPANVFNPDVREARFSKPASWHGITLKDESGTAVLIELIGGNDHENDYQIAFVAGRVPSVGYRTYYLENGEPSSWIERRT
jgi:hypothetical protein